MKLTQPGQAAPRTDIRFIGDVLGSYVLASRARNPSAVQIFACRARSITPFEAVVNAPVQGVTDEVVTVTFETLGILHGRVERTMPGGFVIRFELGEQERQQLAGRIDWLKRRSLKSVSDRRVHKRVLPRETHSRLVVGETQQVECFIIDMSQSGVAVSADVLPPLGAAVGVGSVPGRVVRHLVCGFAVQFEHLHPLEQLEELLTLRTSESRQLAAMRLGFARA